MAEIRLPKVGDVVRVRDHYPFVAGRSGVVTAVRGPMPRADITHVLKQVPSPHCEFFDGMIELLLDGTDHVCVGVHWVEAIS